LEFVILGEQLDARTFPSLAGYGIEGELLALQQQCADGDDAAGDGEVAVTVVEYGFVLIEELRLGGDTEEVLVPHLEVMGKAVVDGDELVIVGMEVGVLSFFHFGLCLI
jgi:hypothetical protein